MFVETDVIEMVRHARRHRAASFRRVRTEHAFIRGYRSQEYSLVLDRRRVIAQLPEFGDLGNEGCRLRAGLTEQQRTGQSGECGAAFGALGEINSHPS